MLAPHTEQRAFVLAGGLSSRMGSDKAKLPFDGSTMLTLLLDRLRKAGFRPTVAARRSQFGEQSSTPCGAPVVEDRFAEAGPLGGLEAALRSFAVAPGEPGQAVLFVAVDLPLLPARLLHLLWQRAQWTGALATVPFVAGKPQPLCAVYRTEMAAGIAAALARGERKVMQVVRGLAPGQLFDPLRIEAVAPLQGWRCPERWFTNVNTPGEYAALLTAAHGNGI